MYDMDHFKKITALDWSPQVIDQMKTKNLQARPEISFEVADCLKMKQMDSKSFDLVIDKATFDVLLTYENPYLTVARYLREVQRILRIGGNFVLITTG